MGTLTVDEGIEIQKKDLAFWKDILKEEVYNDVEQWAVSQNSTAKTGYDVRRGETIAFFVKNYEKN